MERSFTVNISRVPKIKSWDWERVYYLKLSPEDYAELCRTIPSKDKDNDRPLSEINHCQVHVTDLNIATKIVKYQKWCMKCKLRMQYINSFSIHDGGYVGWKITVLDVAKATK